MLKGPQVVVPVTLYVFYTHYVVKKKIKALFARFCDSFNNLLQNDSYLTELF